MINIIESIKDGMGVPHLFQKDINKFSIPLPDIEEQSLISTYLDEETQKIDSLIDQALRAIELLKERRAALISAAVTGKIDVRHLVQEEVPTA